MSVVTFAIPVQDVADRLSVVLTLFLTVVAFKLVIASSMTAVPYLTWMDISIVVCLALLFLVVLLVGVMGTVATSSDDPGAVEDLERTLASFLGFFWVAFHGLIAAKLARKRTARAREVEELTRAWENGQGEFKEEHHELVLTVRGEDAVRWNRHTELRAQKDEARRPKTTSPSHEQSTSHHERTTASTKTKKEVGEMNVEALIQWLFCGDNQIRGFDRAKEPEQVFRHHEIDGEVFLESSKGLGTLGHPGGCCHAPHEGQALSPAMNEEL
mmetsp:Transcript_68582/g.161223  ORF Transcript_68582/g.161223 Transcript_68582/m.161223 type:complete len:271 (+) Transcript_68582:61-873(+)